MDSVPGFEVGRCCRGVKLWHCSPLLGEKQEKLFSKPKIWDWCFQMLQVLAYMHRQCYFHQDLKPENLSVTKDFIKVADFAIVREVCSHTLILTMSPFASMLSPRPCTNFCTLYLCLGALWMVFLVLVLSTLHVECCRVFCLKFVIVIEEFNISLKSS